ncbi:MAG: OsmC family protein [Bacteroidales bacterium]
MGIKNKVSVDWKGKMAFEAEVNGFKLLMDAISDVGGEDKGPRPMPLILSALGGCTGMDVISILAKMKVFPDNFSVDVEAEITEEYPKYYNKIKVLYLFKGNNLPKSKIEKAVALSKERYCGVNKLLSFGAEITHEIKII